MDLTVDLHIEVKKVHATLFVAHCIELPTEHGQGETADEAAIDLMQKGRELLVRATGAKESRLGPLLTLHDPPKS